MKRLIYVFLVLAMLGCVAHASVIFDTLSNNTNSASVALTGPLFDSFLVGSSAVSLSDVILNLKENAAGTGYTTVGLYSNPSTLLSTLGVVQDSQLSLTFATLTITPTTQIILQAHTQYWIGLTGSAQTTTAARWGNTNISTGAIGTTGQSIKNKNGTYADFTQSSVYQMRVDVSSVPEPAVAFTAVFGLGALFLLRRRRAN